MDNIQYKQLNTLKEILTFIKEDRGWTSEQLKAFINNDKVFHSPLKLTNISKAVDKIIHYIQMGKIITIIGDYDVDGICSTVVLFKTLKSISKHINYIIPNRFTDGYGMSNDLIDKAKELKTDLIITVDNGIKCHEQVQYAYSQGIDVIITDHHAFEDDTLPCEITVNPQIDDSYPFKNICGCMVAYKLCLLLIKKLGLFVEVDINTQELAQLTAIATVADIMPLVDENRWFTSHYIPTLINTSNIGLQALFKKLKLKQITATDIGFYVSPCLNAAGRMETAEHSLNLLLSEDSEKVEELASLIVKLNDKRKEIQSKVIDTLKVDDSHNVLFVTPKVKDIGGILGIIASNISNKYNKPCFVLSKHNDILSGSGRSANHYALNRVVECNNYVNGGGHTEACGISFNVNDLDRLQKFADEDYIAYLNDLQLPPIIMPQISFDLINEKLLNNLEKLKPYGTGNPQPIFYSTAVEVENFKVVGKNQNVLQMNLRQNGIRLRGVMFKTTFTPPIGKVNITYALEFNEWNGKKSIQLRINDIS